MTWPLTWFFFFPWSRKEIPSPFLPTQKLREAQSASIQTFPVSHPAMLLPTFILWPSLCMMGGCLLQGGPLSSFKWGTSLLFPLHLLACPPLPSLCQIPIYCLSSPICFSLPCFETWDLDSVSISPLPAGFMLGFVSRGTELKGPCKAMEGEGVSFFLFPVCWFSVGCGFLWTTPSDTQHPSQTTQEAILWSGSNPFTHSPNRFPHCAVAHFLCALLPWQVSCVGHTAGSVFLQWSRTSLCRVWASSLEWRGGSSKLSVPSSCAFPWPWMT